VTLKSVAGACVLLCLAACATPAPYCKAGDGGAPVYVADRGWHVEIGVPAERLEGPLAVYREIFPGARYVMFGYGKKTFITAPATTFSEYVLAPVPGPAAIQVTGLSVTPPEAYGAGETIALALPPGAARGLSDFLWSDLEQDSAGGPRLMARGPFPGSLFYYARSQYSIAHTCNTWAADALDAGGVAVTGQGVYFAEQVMARAAKAAPPLCRMP